MRGLLVAALSLPALAASTSPAMAEPPTTPLPAAELTWAATIQRNGWIFAGSAGQEGAAGGPVIMFTRSTIQPPNSTTIRLWTRQEYQFEQPAYNFTYKSLIDLEEVDCINGRTRLLQESLYPENNMGGLTLPLSTSGPSAWREPIPGSLDDTVAQAACSPK